MLELGVGADILRALGRLYMGLMVLLITVALWLPKRWWQKMTGVGVVLLVFVGPAYMRSQERERLVDEQKKRYEKAKAIFDERCKTAGPKIYRTADDVEGVFLLKVRQYDMAQSNPMMEGAAVAIESFGDSYIRSFLLYAKDPAPGMQRALVENRTITSWPGFQFVEAIDSNDKKRYRYTLDDNTRLKREEVRNTNLRYGVTFEDIVDLADRAYWIAGSTVKVVDLSTNETMAEFTRNAIDPGQGSVAGDRTPWRSAIGCGMRTGYGMYSARLFVDQVLKPNGRALK